MLLVDDNESLRRALAHDSPRGRGRAHAFAAAGRQGALGVQLEEKDMIKRLGFVAAVRRNPVYGPRVRGRGHGRFGVCARRTIRRSHSERK